MSTSTLGLCQLGGDLVYFVNSKAKSLRRLGRVAIPGLGRLTT